MKQNTLLIFSFFIFLTASAQERKVLQLTPAQVEAIFLQQNLQLIAERMNISLAEAQVVQAKLWDNPNLSIGGFNLWQPSGHNEDGSPVVPPFFGSLFRNKQFSIELSQLIQTANKRSKLVARESVSREIAEQQFQVVLRRLKLDLRKSIYEIVYLQANHQILEREQAVLQQLIDSYRKQVVHQNMSKADLVRLQGQALELEDEANANRTALHEQTKNLKTLLSADPFVEIQIKEDAKELVDPNQLHLSKLFLMADENRSDIKVNKLQVKYSEKALAYERAQRVPDLTFSANYDRSGGVWKDFVGFGVSFDLPFFNRNQGSIKAAAIARDQSEYLQRQQQNQAQHEMVEAYDNYCHAYAFYEKISKDELLMEADTMLENFTKNLLNRNISMVEFIDFMNTYKSNKETALNAKKSAYTLFEELQYTVGTEIK